MRTVLNVVWAVTATLAVAACTDYASATDLNPDGPPMVAQVRLKEDIMLSTGGTQQRRVFAFGTHPMVTSEADAHDVTSASATGQSLRIVVDELLKGNNLEEINCRAVVDDDAYDRVPDGATPDDVAGCCASKDVLPTTCSGEHAMCICHNAAGCMVDGETVAMGAPVGVADINQDGSADDTRFIKGAVGIVCGSIDVPIDLDMSYWNPSGDQQVPAKGGYDALGPAIVLVPQNGLPTNLQCHLTFDPSVVDKQGIPVCVPPETNHVADIQATSCNLADNATNFKFTVEPIILVAAQPEEGATGVSRTDDIQIASTNAPLDPATITGITMTEGGSPFAAFTVTYTAMSKLITIHPTATLAATTTYTVTVPTSVTDTFAQPLPAPFVLTFTTGT